MSNKQYTLFSIGGVSKHIYATRILKWYLTPYKLLQSEQLTIQPYRLGHGSAEAVSSLDFSLRGIDNMGYP